MEKLDLLTQRVDSLIQEINRLREENFQLREDGKRLRDDLELGQMAAEELQQKLDQEVATRNEALTRVDDLISRIQGVFPEETQE